MYQQSIPLRDLLENNNRLIHIVQKMVDFASNQKMNIDEITLTLSLSNVYEARNFRESGNLCVKI